MMGQNRMWNKRILTASEPHTHLWTLTGQHGSGCYYKWWTPLAGSFVVVQFVWHGENRHNTVGLTIMWWHAEILLTSTSQTTFLQGLTSCFFLHRGEKIIYVCIKTHHHRQHFYKDRHLDLTLNIALDYCTRDDTHLLTETIQHTNSDKSANSHTNSRAGSWRKKLATTTQLLLMQDSFIFFPFSQGLVEHILIIKTVDAKWSPSFTTIL